jgi:ATP-binding cassette subfamily F protein uup
LVGRNGAGKSTLVRILAGLEPPDHGEIAVRRGASVQLLEQMPTFPDGKSPREIASEGLREWTRVRAEYEAVGAKLEAHREGDHDALLAEQARLGHALERLGGWDREHEVESMLGHLGIVDLDGDVATMSGGERRRVALARLLVADPDLAILDEPTNHLDVETIDWLEEHLQKRHRGAVLLVTHDRYLLDRVCTRTLEIDQGAVHSYDGGYELFLEIKAERLALEERTDANRRNFLRRELEWLARQPKARSTKQKARIERAEAARSEPTRRKEATVAIAIEEARSGKTILEMEKLGIDLGGRTLIQALDLYVTQGERIGVVGRNGTGKTSLLRAVIGQLAPTRGRLTVGANTKVAYFDQERTGLDPDKTVFENVSEGGAVEIAGERLEPRAYLERFLFDPHQQRQKVASLSGGERARAALAKTLQGKKNLVLLDEPTNDLDVDTLAALEGMLIDFGGSALVVTHDRWFLDRVATALLVFEGDGRVVLYPGNYETYRRLRDERAAQAPSRATAASPSSPPSPGRASPSAPPASAPPKGKALSYKEKLELEGLPARIEAAEREIAELEAALADPATYRESADKVKSLTAAVAERKSALAALYARWESLEARAG